MNKIKLRVCTITSGYLYLIAALVDVEIIERAPWLPHSQHDHVFAVCVLVVSDIGDPVQRVAREHTLLLLVCHLDAIL